MKMRRFKKKFTNFRENISEENIFAKIFSIKVNIFKKVFVKTKQKDFCKNGTLG